MLDKKTMWATLSVQKLLLLLLLHSCDCLFEVFLNLWAQKVGNKAVLIRSQFQLHDFNILCTRHDQKWDTIFYLCYFCGIILDDYGSHDLRREKRRRWRLTILLWSLWVWLAAPSSSLKSSSLPFELSLFRDRQLGTGDSALRLCWKQEYFNSH